MHLHLSFHVEKKILYKLSSAIPFRKEAQENGFSKNKVVEQKKINMITEILFQLQCCD